MRITTEQWRKIQRAIAHGGVKVNYDNMNVHELVAALTYAPDNVNIHVRCAHDCSQDHDIIESALRKAVIRESSVGEVAVKIHESEDELTAPKGSTDRIVTVSEQFICQMWIPEGTYYLVKKEET